jgi:hypothetical protein
MPSPFSKLFEPENTGLLIVVALLVGAGIVLSFVGLLMKRVGASLKPLYWFAGFMALIVLPQLAGHLINARMRSQAPTVTGSSKETTESHVDQENQARDLDYSNAQEFFGKRSPGLLVVDGRAAASGLLHLADNPKFFVLPGGETLLIGRFQDANQANRAVTQFWQESRLAGRARTDAEGGIIVERGPSDFVYARAYGNVFTAWSGPSPDAIEQLQIATGVQTSSHSGFQNSGQVPKAEWLDDVLWRAGSSWTGLAIIVAVSAGYLLFIAAYFFKGIAWATRVDAKPVAHAVSAPALRERLLAVNVLDAPFRVEPGTNDNELIATWRYADAKWIDHARAHGMRRLHRIVLNLDEPRRKVRATDFATSFDWSAGQSGAALNWKFMTGVVLFQYEHQRVFGLQIDERGQFKPALSHSYTFDLQEMKSPLAAAVTQSGWIWQPVAWQSPHWLRWLTE